MHGLDTIVFLNKSQQAKVDKTMADHRAEEAASKAHDADIERRIKSGELKRAS